MKDFIRCAVLRLVICYVVLSVVGCGVVFGQIPDWSWGKSPSGLKTTGKSIAVDKFGNSYVTGLFSGQAIFGTTTVNSTTGANDFFIAKYDSEGQLIWIKTGGGTNDDEINDILVDPLGNIFITGQYPNNCSFDGQAFPTGSYGLLFLMKLTNDGDLIWLKTSGGSVGYETRGVALDMDLSGNLLLLGGVGANFTFLGQNFTPSGSNDVFVAKINPNGSLLWIKKFGGIAQDEAFDLKVFPNGDVLFVGHFYNEIDLNNTVVQSNGPTDIFLYRLNSAGNTIWARKFGGPVYEESHSVAVDAQGNVIMGGIFKNSITLGSIVLTRGAPTVNMFLASLNGAGEVAWAKCTSGSADNALNDLCIDKFGNILVCGAYNAPLIFGGAALPNYSYDNIFVGKYYADGQEAWASVKGGGTNSEFAQSVTSDPAGNVLVTGQYGDKIIIGPDTLESFGSSRNLFIAKLGDGKIVPEDGPKSFIEGTIYKESFHNCLPDTSETLLKNRIVKAVPGPFYSISNADGVYSLPVPIAGMTEYSVTSLPQGLSYIFDSLVCPQGGFYSLSLDSVPATFGHNNFGFKVAPCHHLNLEIASNRRRRCVRNSTKVSYTNQGATAAPDAYIIVEFPHWVRPVSGSAPYVALNDSTWRFNLDSVAAGESGSFIITDSVLCGNLGIIGLNQCTKATIYPAPDCPPSSNWSGAEVSVSGVCDQGVVHLGIYNTGSGDMTDSIDYSVFMDSVQVRVGKVKLTSGDSLKLDVDAYGFTITLSAIQVPFHPTQPFVSTTIEACDDTPIYIPRPTVNHFPKPQIANSKTHCLPIRASYDPNDKQAFPHGFTSNHVVKPGTEMEYLVRFQNTGNDTAFTVYVIDSLDNNLNPETLELGAASHAYEISMQTTKQGRTFLRWQFNQINLPDSNENELKSHGFIQYRITPKTGIALGSQAKNEAAIYFDFNPPVFTNQTLTTFDNLVFTNPGLSDSVHVVVPTATRHSLKQLGMYVYPNPFNHTLHLKSATENAVTVSLCDLMGKELKTIQFRSSAELLLTELPAGVYYLKFPELNRVMKVVKE